MVIGGGQRRNYAALVLFLAGGAAGVAVYYTQIGGRWAVPTVLSLVLMLVACGLVAARRDE